MDWPQDCADLTRLVARLRAIAAQDATKAPACGELLAKLARYAGGAPDAVQAAPLPPVDRHANSRGGGAAAGARAGPASVRPA
jgi:hypothetical protein